MLYKPDAIPVNMEKSSVKFVSSKVLKFQLNRQCRKNWQVSVGHTISENLVASASIFSRFVNTHYSWRGPSEKVTSTFNTSIFNGEEELDDSSENPSFKLYLNRNVVAQLLQNLPIYQICSLNRTFLDNCTTILNIFLWFFLKHYVLFLLHWSQMRHTFMTGAIEAELCFEVYNCYLHCLNRCDKIRNGKHVYCMYV